MSACHIRTADGARWAVEYDADGEPLRAQLRDWPYTIRPTGCEEQVIDGPTSRRLDHRFDELRCGRSVVCIEHAVVEAQAAALGLNDEGGR